VLPEDVPPDLALRTLLEGNARYAAERSIHPNLSAERRQELSLGQRPWASILGCSDSRVPPELVFDVGPGDMFDVREAGNVASAVSLESLTYSVEHLHSRLILVLGHTSCGAVHAVFEDQAQEYPEIEHLIKPAIAGIDDEFSAVKANALAQRQTVADHPALAEEIGSGHIEVHAAYFDLATGRVTLLAA
jgi:carbonic anhydrase